ncbi:cupredoxin domain-containing protein [Natrialbaceae archaeon AArc-T1-2]|uniref:cupredoxin domain-containing protein n=1 Tax=Natrialbaceae archaeon AArc-T1-2 TaxID=3053904 RepID=UPI00255ACD34|nr:plastocyanin/azurin family copper-binding protein [Natrialbaceae archaeon AArc-T1-2]WIV66645.1 plastocyanin/azurin family copper-binding protein [Natrialbaceae archaeon AArc-T1-2]
MQCAALIGSIGLAGCIDGNDDAGADDSDVDDDADADDSDVDDDADADDESIAGSEEENFVVVGPDGAWIFDPEEITVDVGETVTWYFDSPGHNVTSHPDAADQTENPEGAEPFTSYDGDNHLMVDDPGTEFEHTFEVPGEYVYVCTPHVPSMAGTVVVQE